MTAVLPPPVDPVPGWSQSLSDGAPGVALLHIELARCGLSDWATVQQWATAITRHEVSTHSNASLFRGAPAVAFALHCANRKPYAPPWTPWTHRSGGSRSGGWAKHTSASIGRSCPPSRSST